MLPILKYDIQDPALGICGFALLDDPAVEVHGECYSKDLYVDEERHCLTSCLVRVDYPIYRAPNANYPNGYAVLFTKEVAKFLAKSIFKLNPQANLDHTDNTPDGVELLEVFIKDSARGISPECMKDCADGSVGITVHITNEDLWQQVKEGHYDGFSLETFYNDLIPYEPDAYTYLQNNL